MHVHAQFPDPTEGNCHSAGFALDGAQIPKFAPFNEVTKYTDEPASGFSAAGAKGQAIVPMASESSCTLSKAPVSANHSDF